MRDGAILCAVAEIPSGLLALDESRDFISKQILSVAQRSSSGYGSYCTEYRSVSTGRSGGISLLKQVQKTH